MEHIRAFVAVEIPESAREPLIRIQRSLRQSLPSLAYVKPEGIHVTLKFLGEISAEQLPGIAAAVRAATLGFPKFRLSIDGLGTFPAQGQPRVVWLGLKGDLRLLTSLAERLEKAMRELGIPQEDRPFAPHLTLARVRQKLSPEELATLRRLGEKVNGPVGPEFEVTEVSVMRSHLQRGGAVYHRLEAFPLGDNGD